MTQAFWKVYKAKVIQTLGVESQEEDLEDKIESPKMMETTDSTLLTEEESNPVSQLAQRVQGAGAKSCRTAAFLFSREDEHKLLASEPCADHPLAAKPEEDSASKKRTAGLWDVFASKWQQPSGLEKMVDPREPFTRGRSGETVAEEEEEEAGGTGQDNDLREAEGMAFKWSFLTNKLVEMKNRSISKSN
ncbi:uncharacterized protein C1orf232-like [Anolis sagrei]|uniref:uncharacterized protein C1orf232-like n=1 Tax=Anolis sagrei TaxID=38937 RepID=UPI003521CF5F